MFSWSSTQKINIPISRGLPWSIAGRDSRLILIYSGPSATPAAPMQQKDLLLYGSPLKIKLIYDNTATLRVGPFYLLPSIGQPSFGHQTILPSSPSPPKTSLLHDFHHPSERQTLNFIIYTAAAVAPAKATPSPGASSFPLHLFSYCQFSRLTGCWMVSTIPSIVFLDTGFLRREEMARCLRDLVL